MSAQGIFVSTKHRSVIVPVKPDLPDLSGVIPGAKALTHEGKDMFVVPHTEDGTKILRNFEYEVPAPILYHYDWEGGTPFHVQKRTAALLTMNKRAYVLNSFGTGKTKTSLWAWRYLNRLGLAKKLLVVAPLSTLSFTWGREIFETLPGMKSQVLYGTKKKRLQKLADTEADIYIINHDGLKVIEKDLEERDDIDTIILDELAVYRNGTASRTKTVRKIVSQMQWAWGMTGSPTPNAPTDAWSQCSILTPDTVPKYFNRFRDEVMFKVSQFRWVPKENALDKVFEVMQPSVRYALDDVLELPDLIERTIDVEMGVKQAKIYKEMERQAHTMILNKEITAMNAGAVLGKLLQISTGYVYAKDREVVSLDNDARLTALVDAINSTDRKVIVFVPFIHAMEGVEERLTKEGFDVRTVSGATSDVDRREIFNLFQNTESVKVLVAHPQTMAHGLTLTAADTIIWFAPLPNLEIFEQANARIRRIGQKHKQQILMFCATTAEKKMYAKLRAKQRVQDMLLDLFAEASV